MCSSGANAPFFLIFSETLHFQRRPKLLVWIKELKHEESLSMQRVNSNIVLFFHRLFRPTEN